MAARAQRALVEHGGVQCGFCTPGMVVALTRLLTDKPAPTRDEVADAIGGNICRCTGYGKIVDAMVALSAQDVVNGSDLDAGGLRLVGRRVPRLDGAPKAAGSSRYVDDLVFPQLLHARLVRSPVAHARGRGRADGGRGSSRRRDRAVGLLRPIAVDGLARSGVP